MTDVTRGLVTTIMPVFNRAALLREAVASILAQTYRPIEIIIVDDGSTDDTGDVAAELARLHPSEIRLLYQPNGGVGRARETGRQAARGEFVQYLDSDDVLLPTKFACQVAALESNPECGIAYGRTRYRRIDGGVEMRPHKSLDHAVEHMFPSFLLRRAWETATPLYRRDLLERAGPWLSLSHEEDWEYDCRVAALRPRLVFCDEIVAEYREHVGVRLSGGPAVDAARLADRARAQAAILRHARQAGLSDDSPEMRQFARSLFLLCRQCGAAGLARESSELFELSRDAAGATRARGWDYRGYRGLATMFGWPFVGSLACRLDDVR